MVKRTGLGSLCLSKSGGVPRMCMGAVESVKRVVISELIQFAQLIFKYICDKQQR